MGLNFTSTGKGLSANIAGVASLTTFACKIMVDSAAFQAMGSGATGVGYGAWDCDQDGAGTNRKFEVYLQNNGSHQVGAAFRVTGIVNTQTPYLTLGGSNIPAAGTPFVIYCYYTSGTQLINVTTTAGALLNDGTNSMTASLSSIGTPTTGTSGRVSMNNCEFGAQAANYGGGAIYSASLAGAAQYSAPASGDANIVAMWKENDAFGGTTPTTAAATVGGQGLVLTGGQFNWSAFGSWFVAPSVPPPRQPIQGSFIANRQSRF